MTPKEIRAFRAQLGLSQWGLAVRLGYDPMTISRWERGVQRPPRLLASALRDARVLFSSVPPRRRRGPKPQGGASDDA